MDIIVIREFSDSEKQYKRNEIVKKPLWPNLDSMLRMRMVEIYEEENGFQIPYVKPKANQKRKKKSK
jgi:hypothetical protein